MMMDQHSNKKRPVRLLPPSFFRSEKNETAIAIRRFYGPPTNCSELSQLGYTLNGYYQVKSANISDIIQVETVYCQFKHPEGIFNPSGNEKRISSSHLQLPKSGSVGTGVHFYATLKSFEETTPFPTIEFVDVKVNIGDAYDSKSGMFMAPKSGAYNFLFMGYVDSGNLVHVALHKNKDIPISFSAKMGPGHKPKDPVIQTVVELKRGDTIQVKCTECEGSSLSFLSFSGSLLQEL